MNLRRVLLAFVFTEISNQQLHAFICRDVCNIRMTHITRLGRIEIMKTFKSIMNRMILRYVALLLAICRGGILCSYLPLLHWKQHGSAKQVPEIVRILSFVSSFSFNGCKYRIIIHVFCKVGVTKKYFLTCFISSPFLFQCYSGESSSFMVYIRSYLVKRCNKKNDLRSF